MSLPELLQKLLNREKRRGWRKNVNVAALIPLEKGPTLPVEITEASPTGFRLRAPRKLPRGKALWMLMSPLPPDRDQVEIPIEIRWNRHANVGAFSYRCGGRFLEMTDYTRRKLAERLLITTGLDMADVAEKRRDTRLQQQAIIGGDQMAVRDISASGVGLVARKGVPVGEIVEVVLNLGVDVRARGEVVWSRPAGAGKVFHLGVRFQDMDDKLRLRLVDSIDSLIKEARNGGPSNPFEN